MDAQLFFALICGAIGFFNAVPPAQMKAVALSLLFAARAKRARRNAQTAISDSAENF